MKQSRPDRVSLHAAASATPTPATTAATATAGAARANGLLHGADRGSERPYQRPIARALLDSINEATLRPGIRELDSWRARERCSDGLLRGRRRSRLVDRIRWVDTCCDEQRNTKTYQCLRQCIISLVMYRAHCSIASP